jgi:glycosyltransferase involved in cell wall biosynthesis
LDKGISIITIVLNQKSLIEGTIKSVICQKNINIEYIIIDGGSTDGTLEIIDKYKKYINTIISEADGGIYHAINKGISLATYPLVGLIHCGDCYVEDALSKVYKVFQEISADVIYGDIEIKEKNGKEFILRKSIANHKMLRKCMSIFHPSTFVKLSIYKEFGVYNNEYCSAADYDFFLRLYLQKFNFVHIPVVLATFRSGGLSSKKYKLSLNENYQIRKKHLGFISALSYTMATICTHSFYSVRRFIITLIIGEKLYFKIKRYIKY